MLFKEQVSKYKRINLKMFRRILQKILRTNILENGTGKMLLIVVLMVGLWFWLQMKTVDQNDSIFTCLTSFHIFVRI